MSSHPWLGTAIVFEAPSLTCDVGCSEQLRFGILSPAEIVKTSEISVYSPTLYEVMAHQVL